MNRTKSHNRILTTHVGSLVRPDELVEFLLRVQDREEVDQDEFAEALRSSVEWVVGEQKKYGVDIVSDGEYGKTRSWARYLFDRIDGIELRTDVAAVPLTRRGSNDMQRFAEFYEEYHATTGRAGMGKLTKDEPGRWHVTSEIRYTGHDKLHADITRLKDAMAARGVEYGFLPVVAPTSAVPSLVDEFYGDREALLFGFAEALNEEYRTIIDAGLMIQVDDAFLASMYDVMVPPGSMEEYREWAAKSVEATNHALRNLPEDKIRYHVCWGSWNGPHSNDVNARDIIDLILRINAGGYALEMANPRHEHEWRVWEDTRLPDGKTLYPGVISHATNIVEHPELVAERIVRLANLVGRENVVASTDCGFAQGPFTRRVHPSIMWAKLEALSEGAKLATAELWE